MKNLVIGDPHEKPEDLDEGHRLFDRVAEIARKTKPDVITITGDGFDSFEWAHVKVTRFWLDVLNGKLNDWKKRWLLGNHDGPHDPEPGVHALSVFQFLPRLEIIDRPMVLDHMLWVPFMRDNAEFVKAVNAFADRGSVVYCHQEFNGAKYDNGFPSKVGVEPESIDGRIAQFISGHIHSGQEFGKIWYVGAPRWRTAADANKDRFIWLIDHDDETGAVLARNRFPTDPACTRLVHLEDTPSKPVDPAAQEPAWKMIVDICGPEAWCKERKALWAGRARIRTFVSRDRPIQVRESDGIDVALGKYLRAYQPKYGATTDRLVALARERLQVDL